VITWFEIEGCKHEASGGAKDGHLLF